MTTGDSVIIHPDVLSIQIAGNYTIATNSYNRIHGSPCKRVLEH